MEDEKEEEEEELVVEAQSDLVPADWSCFDHDFAAPSQINVVARPNLVQNASVSPESLVADREPV